jgi:hypothetical protein
MINENLKHRGENRKYFLTLAVFRLFLASEARKCWSTSAKRPVMAVTTTKTAY